MRGTKGVSQGCIGVVKGWERDRKGREKSMEGGRSPVVVKGEGMFRGGKGLGEGQEGEVEEQGGVGGALVVDVGL